MANVIAINRADDGVSIMCLVEASEASILIEVDKFKAAHPGEYVSHTVVDEALIPSDRTFRNAWKLAENALIIDMPTARTIHTNRIRAVRNLKLDKLDKDLAKAAEQGHTTDSIKTLKQTLRDIPQNFDLTQATTPEELAGLWPNELL